MAIADAADPRPDGRRGRGLWHRFLGLTGDARSGRGIPLGSRLRNASARVVAWLIRQSEIEAEARSGFFLVPGGMMLGIALFYAAGWRPPIPLSVAVCLPLLLGAALLGPRKTAGAACLLAGFVAAGLALSGYELASTKTVLFSGEATVRIAGRVAGREQDERGRLRYRVAIETTERPVLSRPPGIAEILVSSRHAPIPVGGRYAGLVRLRAPSGPAFPSGYDFSFGNYFDGVGANGFGLGPPDPPAAGAAPSEPTVGERILALRLSMSERIRSVIGGPAGTVASALITGDRAGIPDDIQLWLRTTGLSHVLSISGLHMALVAGFAMFLVRAGLAAIPGVALCWPIKKIAAVAALGVVTFYILLSGRNVAADRSYLMLAIMLVAILVDRAAITLRSVALAAIVVLAMAPHALMTASFQMSFGATASLVGVYGHVARAQARRQVDAPPPGRVRQLVVFLVGLGASSLIAGTATGPFASYHFQRMAPFGLFANLLALPLFSVWIMPLALCAVVAMPFGLDAVFLILMGQGLKLVFGIAHFLHDHLPDTPTGLLTPEGLVLLSVALLLACFLASGLRWLALPVAALGLALAPATGPRPELLVFEDGRELALIGAGNVLVPLRPKPNGFVLTQWQRAYPDGAHPADADVPTDAGAPLDAGVASDARAAGFRCEALAPASDVPTASSSPSAAAPQPSRSKPPLPGGAAGSAIGPNSLAPAVPSVAVRRAPRPMQICRATTRSGLRVVWTDDYRQIGTACDSADVAIVARAARREACRSGAVLVTLRTLRRTGSLAISRSTATGRAEITAAIAPVPEPWQVQRLAPWPEIWRRAVEAPPEKPGP